MAETLRAHLSLLYRCGKQSFPEQAEAMGSGLEELAEHRAAWSSQLVRAGSPPALTKAIEINDTVYELLRRATLTWQDAAYAMVAIADDLVQTDANAAAEASQVSFILDDVPMPQLSPPPTLEESQR